MSKKVENQEEQVQQDAPVEQPKPKKRRHKGAIIAWSIIGTVVLVIGGVMFFALNSMKNKSPAANIAGKTFVADTDEDLVVIMDGKYEADSDAAKKVKDKVASESAKGDEGAKEVAQLMTTYGSDTIKNKFKDSYVTCSGISLFSYDDVTATLYNSSDTEWYHCSYKVNSNRNGMEVKLVGDEREQLTKLHAVDSHVSFGLTTRYIMGDVYYFHVFFNIGTATVDSKTYSIVFSVNYWAKK